MYQTKSFPTVGKFAFAVNSILVLHVDDDPDFADMAAHLLESSATVSDCLSIVE